MIEFLHSLMPNLMENFPEFLKAIQETMIMLSISGIVSFFFGTAFGVLLIVTRRGDGKLALGNYYTRLFKREHSGDYSCIDDYVDFPIGLYYHGRKHRWRRNR